MMLKRRMNKKTNYDKRLSLLRSRKTRAVVRKHLKNVRVQFVQYGETGDATLVDVSSGALSKFGWKAHGGSVPAAYLVGLLAGKQALSSGVKEAVLDIGLQSSVNGAAIFACAQGIKDAGINMPFGAKLDEKRIRGEHIANYAKKLKSEDSNKFEKQFSLYLKNNVQPENLPAHFQDVKQSIEKAALEKKVDKK